eukprot:3940744-Rhodomonas_salina.8
MASEEGSTLLLRLAAGARAQHHTRPQRVRKHRQAPASKARQTHSVLDFGMKTWRASIGSVTGSRSIMIAASSCLIMIRPALRVAGPCRAASAQPEPPPAQPSQSHTRNRTV